MLKVILIDDEPKSLKVISSLIELYHTNIEIIGMYTDPYDGLNAILKDRPDILLLDIEMPGLTGLELVRRIPEIDFEVVFITAYNQYAINAIRLCALDYLLKPVDPTELMNALHRADQKIKEREVNEKFKVLVELLEHKKTAKNIQDHRIALSTSNTLEFVRMNNVIRIEADKGYCTFCLSDGPETIVSKNLGIYEQSLEEYDFMRVHRSHIVNLHYVRRYIRQDGGGLEMEDESKVPVSIAKKEELMLRLNNL